MLLLCLIFYAAEQQIISHHGNSNFFFEKHSTGVLWLVCGFGLEGGSLDLGVEGKSQPTIGKYLFVDQVQLWQIVFFVGVGAWDAHDWDHNLLNADPKCRTLQLEGHLDVWIRAPQTPDDHVSRLWIQKYYPFLGSELKKAFPGRGKKGDLHIALFP